MASSCGCSLRLARACRRCRAARFAAIRSRSARRSISLRWSAMLARVLSILCRLACSVAVRRASSLLLSRTAVAALSYLRLASSCLKRAFSRRPLLSVVGSAAARLLAAASSVSALRRSFAAAASAAWARGSFFLSESMLATIS